ncbi:MAG: STM4014 family protein [Anaerolineae bacterium]|nr:STM4014 family protein [Anaerolineae bacterium]
MGENRGIVPSVSSTSRFVVIANPDSRPLGLFQEALARCGLLPARLVSYADLIAGRMHLAEVVRAGDIVRIETPGRDFEIERQLIALGAGGPDLQSGISAEQALSLDFDKGRIWYPRQWYLGFCKVLRRIDAQLAGAPPHHNMHQTEAVMVMFDKPRCHTLLANRGIAVAPALRTIHSYAELHEEMHRVGWPRVFVKLANGSSASGVVAYQTDGRRHRAITTVEMTHSDGELRLYNTRRIQVYEDWHIISDLLDALCRHHVHVEQWLPKAGFEGRVFDLRVVVIAEKARHTIARLSRSPMTNLHLLNDRCDFDAIRSRIADWDAARKSCEDALACFPGSLYTGVDLLITSDYRRHAILEMNAFGDLLPGCLHEGLDTYETEIQMQLDAIRSRHAQPQ